MAEITLTREDLQKQVENLQSKITELETVKAAYEQVEEELRLRHTQLKASEKELKQTHDLLKDRDDKIQKLNSEQEGADKKLLNSERRFLNLVENYPGMVAIQDVKQRKYVYWNRSTSWSGHTLEEWNLLSYNDQKTLIHPEDRSRYMQLLREWVPNRSEDPLVFDYRLRHKDGHYLSIECHFYKDFSLDGQVVAQIELSQDITDTKHSEEALHDEQERYITITTNQMEVICKTDRDGKFTFVSPSYCETFKQLESDLLGQDFSPPIHEDDIEETTNAVNSIKQPPYKCYNENRVLAKDGWTWFGWWHKAIIDANDNFLGAVTIGRDISEMKQMKKDLDALSHDVEKQLEEHTKDLLSANKKLTKQIEQIRSENADQLERRAKVLTLWDSIEDFIYEVDEKTGNKRIRDSVLQQLGTTESEFNSKFEALEYEGESQRQQRSNLQMMMDSIDDMVFVMDSKGHIVYVNPIVLSRLGYSMDELLSMNILEIHPPDMRDQASGQFSDMISGKTKSYSVPICTKESKLLHVDSRFTLSRWNEKNVVIAISRDITSFKDTEDELKSSMKTFKTLAEQSACGVCIIQDTTIQYANKHFADIFGIDPDEVNDWDATELEKIVHPDDRGIFTARAIKKRQSNPTDNVSHISFRASNLKGNDIWADLYSKPVDHEDNPAELLIIIDSTEGKHAQELQLKAEIRQRENHKQEAVERLAGTMAHNFNELLTIITGHSELALMSVSKIDPIRANIEAINRAAVTGSNLTWQLLTYARRYSFQSKLLDPKEIFTALDDSLRRVLGKNIDLVINVSEKLGQIKTDPEQFERVIQNLIQNSKEALPKGGSVVIDVDEVEIDKGHPHYKLGFKEDSYVRLAFTDTGKGMTTEQRKRMFDPFYSTKDNGKSSGLGLSMVYGMVKKSGGHVWVDSQPDEGTTFTLYFPLQKEGSADDAAHGESDDLYGNGETILVVEDDDRVREMAAAILKEYGYKVLQAGSGKEAQLLCEELESPVDLILSDVFMPNIGGIEMVEKIKTLWPNVNVMYMSGAAADGSIDGSIPFLKKPFSSTELAQTVRSLISG